MTFALINGPNLNLTGTREPQWYGTETFETFLSFLSSKYTEHHILYFQSNHEGALIDFIQNEASKTNGIIINAGAYAHTSIALADALIASKLPTVEVHLSNIYKREVYRHHSFIATQAQATLSGMGLMGYDLALQYLINTLI